jgi:hypothetical protein
MSVKMGSHRSNENYPSADFAESNSLLVAPLLPLIAEQAAEADATRSVAPTVIAALKGNDVMRMSAVRALGGLESSVTAIGRELEAVAAACGSTGWCLWNHLCVFHFYCGLLGPAHIGLLRSITANRHWVCMPAGAGTGVIGRVDGDEVVLNGIASFGCGEKPFLIVPTDGKSNATIHQRLQVNLTQQKTFCDGAHYRRRDERQLGHARHVAFGESFATRDLDKRSYAAGCQFF